MSADLYNKLISYAESGTYPFHMPGHKMGRGIGEYDIFKTDITEINGFDNLHNPDGIIKDAQKKYASLFGAKKTFFCVNGATGALQAAIMSVCGPNDTVIMARNCHRSVYSAMILTGAKRFMCSLSIVEKAICREEYFSRILKKQLKPIQMPRQLS